jgi:endonuclease-3
MNALKTLPGGLSVDSVMNIHEDEISRLIFGVSFHNQKARNIKKSADMIKNEFHGKLPEEISSLLTLPGVGPKMANLVMNCAFNKSDGICVDTHVHRICTKLGWGCKKCQQCKQPEHTRLELEKWLPREIWREFTVVLVGLGQLLQTGKEQLLEKCQACRDPETALKLMKRLGLKVVEKYSKS